MRNAILRLHNYSDCTERIPYSEKFSRDKIFAVFADLPQTAKLNSEILPTMQTTPFPSKPFESLASVCAMAMYRYFSSVDKLPKLPDATGSLPTKVSSSSIVLANAGVKSVLKSLLAKGKGLCQAVA